MNKKNSFKTFLLNILFPCLIMSFVVGVIVGVVGFFFKVAAGYLVTYSNQLYGYVRNDYRYIPVMYVVLLALAVASYFITKYYKCAKGGGIPTTCGILRGMISFRWLSNLIATIGSAFMTYIAGLSLGEEGQSVQIGTCIGKGVSKISGKKQKAWERYVMTGGASAGFAVATGAPLSGIFFSLEEAHKRFSPMIIMSAMTTTIFGYLTSGLLKRYTNFPLHEMVLAELDIPALGIENIWMALIIGLLVGFAAYGVNTLFQLTESYWRKKMSKFPRVVEVMLVFVVSGTIGLFLPESLGGGVGLINVVAERKVVIWMIVILYALKTFLALFSNSSGVTGGLFVPTLCQGVLLGGLFGEAMIACGFSQEIYLPIVIITTTAYLAAVQRIPITAVVFSFEIFGGIKNSLYILIAVCFAYLIVEMMDAPALNDLALNHRLREDNEGRAKKFVETKLVVQSNSFAIGKMVRDIFWPANCQVLSMTYKNRTTNTNEGDKHIHEGDILTLRYEKFMDDKDESNQILCSILGEQDIPDPTICS